MPDPTPPADGLGLSPEEMAFLERLRADRDRHDLALRDADRQLLQIVSGELDVFLAEVVAAVTESPQLIPQIRQLLNAQPEVPAAGES